MTLAGIVVRSLRHRALSTALSALAVALGVALVVAVETVRAGALARFKGAAGAWSLVVGPKGSPLQAVLFSLFHMDKPDGKLPESRLLALQADGRVEVAVPLCLGDAYRGFRIVGTEAALFGREVRPGLALSPREGRLFEPFRAASRNFEAVVGSTAARAAGLGIGSKFVAVHGLDGGGVGHEHDEAPWTVVGVLPPTGTPSDRVIFIHREAFYAIEGHGGTPREPAGDGHDGHDDHGHGEPDAHGDHEAHGDGGAEGDRAGAPPPGDGAGREVSSILVRVRNPIFLLMLQKELQDSADATPAMPLVEVGRLFEIVGNADRLLVAVSALVALVAALGILVSMTNALHERRREIALWRALGAPRRVVAGLIVAEAAAVGVLGGVAGLVLGHAVAAGAGAWMAERLGVAPDALAFQPAEIGYAAAAAALCALAGLLPAVRAYRSEPAEGLAPTS
jgi:putative ABC transport system permease protein